MIDGPVNGDKTPTSKAEKQTPANEKLQAEVKVLMAKVRSI